MPWLDKDETGRLMTWLFLLVFFVCVPPVVLYFASFIASLLSDPAQPVKLLSNFKRDLPLFILTFYAGTTGGIVAYVFGRTQLGRRSDPMVTRIAKLLFAGLLGVGMFLLLQSAALINLLYPNLKLQPGAFELEYHPMLASAFLAGLMGPSLVRSLQSKSRRMLSRD